MTYHSIRNTSLSVSILFHLLLFGLFFIWVINVNYQPREYVELSFGVSGKNGSSGNIGTQINEVEEMAKTEEKNETKNQAQEVKEVKLPKAESTSEDNTITPADKNKKITKESKVETKEKTNSNITTPGKGNKAEGKGSFGVDIDWGGSGQRKIYSYVIPAYPEGVEKEIDIRLRFSILPDGTVGTILPLTKADTRLEDLAINSLRQWRFEPLDPSRNQSEQSAIIVFPFRLQ